MFLFSILNQQNFFVFFVVVVKIHICINFCCCLWNKCYKKTNDINFYVEFFVKFPPLGMDIFLQHFLFHVFLILFYSFFSIFFLFLLNFVVALAKAVGNFYDHSLNIPSLFYVEGSKKKKKKKKKMKKSSRVVERNVFILLGLGLEKLSIHQRITLLQYPITF